MISLTQSLILFVSKNLPKQQLIPRQFINQLNGEKINHKYFIIIIILFFICVFLY
jgi:hypothetical protein